MLRKIGFAAAVLAVAVSAGAVRAQTAEQAWLKYNPAGSVATVPTHIETLGQSPLQLTAAAELRRGLSQLSPNSPPRSPEATIILGTAQEMRWRKRKSTVLALEPDEFVIQWNGAQLIREFDIMGGSDRGVLYGVFALLRILSQGADFNYVSLREKPAMPIRWVDEWDNAAGSIERGYGGRSIFFEAGHVREDLAPVGEYARLLASVGINGCNVNNVNNAAPFLQPDMLRGIARIADAMRPWGVRVALSADIASPQTIGGLSTFDPLDPAVIAWWKAKVDEIYTLIPDFAGFTVKADSEGQPGPASYGRTPADAANLLANALAPHGGVVLYRAFVYNHHADWRDPKADRARAAYDIFHPLDGKFAANVIVQTKEGPIDFQAQEPVSPLLGGLEKTNQAMELQITQEYLGQQRHLVYIAPMWKGVLDFDLRAENRATPVKEILAGKSFHRPLGGMVGVAGVGQNWLGSPLALANLYAFGRLAWNPNLSPADIAVEWTRQTISNDPEVVRTVANMLMQSWPAYVHYTGPLGMQTLTDITGSHYGPNIESSENNGWGQWHRADRDGVGMDRTVATGTGYAGQYWPEVARVYENAATTPDDLLTFFHHVPYTYKLHLGIIRHMDEGRPEFRLNPGKTVIQYIYDSHYQGAAEAAHLAEEWATLEGKIDPALFADIKARLAYQAGHAIVWRDAIVQYFLKLSGVPDEHGRAGHYPHRLEAEDARLTGYTVIDVKPWEDASGGKAVSCSEASCSAEWTYAGRPGRFNIAIQYFDLQPGAAKFTLSIDRQPKDQWTADAQLPSRRPNGDNSTRFTVRGIDLKPGDILRVEGTPDGSDPAALDYIELLPAANPG
ncbi:MAG TPA: alpha-glucuronidase family glycosyl hydrolase [Terracidiphilus sp.]|jgi:alpha-glucuronidase|nr:alpha-glucuronidase family glycosyl hydrolase [Terracidiphilus sp.]